MTARRARWRSGISWRTASPMRRLQSRSLHLTRRSGFGLQMLVVVLASVGLAHGQTPDANKHAPQEAGPGALAAQQAVPMARARDECLVLPPRPEDDDSLASGGMPGRSAVARSSNFIRWRRCPDGRWHGIDGPQPNRPPIHRRGRRHPTSRPQRRSCFSTRQCRGKFGPFGINGSRVARTPFGVPSRPKGRPRGAARPCSASCIA